MSRNNGSEMHLSSAASSPPAAQARAAKPRASLSEPDDVRPPAPVTQEPVPEPAAVEYPDIPAEVVVGQTSPWKRLMDFSVGSILIGILWPIFALAAILIKLESPGPVLIKQDRVGLNGRGFRFLKFRTMHHNRKGSDIAERLPTGDLKTRLLSPKGRPEHATAIGWTLRKTTVDELPQLVNVVTGDMSLIGPRPDIQEIVDAWPVEFRQRHKVKPGMTGLAQVNGRSDLTHYEKVRYDLRYVARHPLSLDIRILLKTVTLVFSKKGAR